MGRNAKTVYADGAAEYSYYNTKGQLIRSVDADGVATLYQYNGQGEVEYTAVDVDQDSVIDFAGLDRVNQTVRDVTTISSVNVRRTRTYQLATDNSSTPLLVNESRVSTDGLQSWNIAFGLTTQSVTTVNTGTGARTTTVTNPDGSTTVSVYSFGRLQTVTRKNSGGTQIAKTTYAYDPHGRVASVTDARNGATVYTYGAGDAVATVTTPAPGTGAPAQTTTSLYDTSGRAWKTVLADGTSTTNEFFLTGQLKKTYGSRSYPVEYTYDPAGRMKTMKTWQNFTGNSGTAITTWNYHTNRGWLSSKDYANAATGAAGTTGPDYTYTPSGRLKTRTWAREYSAGNRIVTTYKYGFDDATGGNSHGDLTEVSYNDGVTATVGYAYDRRGLQTTVTQGGNTTTRYHLDAGLSLGERYSGGTLGGLNVTNTFDSYLRRSTVSFRNGTTALGTSTYGYDTASRLTSVTDGTYSATYAYQTDSSLVDTLTFKTSGSTRLTTQKRYDRLNRLQIIVSTPSAANQALPSFTYQYNDANQRTSVTLGDGSHWVYDYDSLGQVKGGKRYWNDGTPVAGQQFEYGFDDIGNRTNSKRGGDENGANLRETTYARNYLNQYAGRTNLVNRYADVLGLATFNQSSPASVIVNSQTAYRRSEYWRSELSLGGSNALWQSVTVNVGTTTNTGNLFVSPTPEAYTFDLDGNLTADGRWTYTWDAENRLTQMESLSGNPSGSKRKLAFEYDANSRRIGKKVYVWNGSAYPGSPNTTLKFVYDGWNLLAELDGSNAVVRSYQWGTDLSGSLQGAGGVGGLLSVKPSGSPAQFVAYDGNGNVAALVDGTSGAVTATYEYGPFGELIRSSGTQAANPMRFSSKYQDTESDLLYYAYRYYNASTGRWINRDPIEEEGGPNLQGFVANSAVNFIDPLGLAFGLPIMSGNFHDVATRAIANLERDMRGYEIGKVTGLFEALQKLQSMIPKVRWVTIDPEYIDNGTAAEYVGALNWIRLGGNDPAPGEVAHETVHAYNKLISGLSKDDRVDEGMAYTFEQTYGALTRFKVIEDMLNEGCHLNKQRIAGRWKDLWAQYAAPGNFPGGMLNDKNRTSFNLTGKDFANVSKHFGLKFSCGALADALTKLASRNGCCLFFTCDAKPSSPYSVPAGVQIDEAFK